MALLSCNYNHITQPEDVAIVALPSGNYNHITQDVAIVALLSLAGNYNHTARDAAIVALHSGNSITSRDATLVAIRSDNYHHITRDAAIAVLLPGHYHHITRDVQSTTDSRILPRILPSHCDPSLQYLPSFTHTHYHDNTEPKIVALALPPAESSIISVGRFALCSPERKKEAAAGRARAPPRVLRPRRADISGTAE